MKLHVYKWSPENLTRYKGVVQIAHGMAEHAQRYSHFAEFLTKNGYVVYANDHRGHGLTAKDENAYGYFAPKNGWHIVCDDMLMLSKQIKIDYPDVPLILLGHSMGSFLSRTYLCKHSGLLKGCILTGTAGSPGIIRHIARLIIFIYIQFKGGKARVKLLDTMSFGEFNKKIKNARTPYDWISSDDTVVDKYVEDPKCGGLFTVKFFQDLVNGLGYIHNKKNLKNMRKELPLLILSGAEDPVGDFGKGVKKAHKMFTKLQLKDLTFKLYPEMRHEIINEKEKQIVYDDILQWLDTRTNAVSK